MNNIRRLFLLFAALAVVVTLIQGCASGGGSGPRPASLPAKSSGEVIRSQSVGLITIVKAGEPTSPPALMTRQKADGRKAAGGAPAKAAKPIRTESLEHSEQRVGQDFWLYFATSDQAVIEDVPVVARFANWDFENEEPTLPEFGPTLDDETLVNDSGYFYGSDILAEVAGTEESGRAQVKIQIRPEFLTTQSTWSGILVMIGKESSTSTYDHFGWHFIKVLPATTAAQRRK